MYPLHCNIRHGHLEKCVTETFRDRALGDAGSPSCRMCDARRNRG